MNKNELKKVLKPLIKQCIKEVIFEEGVLSNIIAEVATGLTTSIAEPIVENKPPPRSPRRKEKAVSESKKRLLDSISRDAYNGVDLFENTNPISKAGAPGDVSTPRSPLSSYAPDDAGVDINGILSIAGSTWSKLV
jgi:hypothetical protein